jgi:hypothetical protein
MLLLMLMILAIRSLQILKGSYFDDTLLLRMLVLLLLGTLEYGLFRAI